MPEGKLKSRKLRRIYVKTPGGRTTIHYKDRKPKIAHCGQCGAVLKGTIRALPSKLKKLGKTKKRAERPYPNLCSKCMRQKIVSEVRKNV
jgi:large subunit ribosomal protein L34e